MARQRGRQRSSPLRIGEAEGFLDVQLQFTNHVTVSTNSPKESREGEVLLTFSVITVQPGPPSQPAASVKHQTVARLAMSRAMALNLRDLMTRNFTASTEPHEEGSEEDLNLEDDSLEVDIEDEDAQ